MSGRRHPTITWMRAGIGRLHAAMQQTAAGSSGRLPTMPARPPADQDQRSLPLNDRDLLLRLMAGAATGDVLARQAGLTRAAVWKRIAALRSAGVDVRAQPGRGYVLAQPLDLLDADAIRAGLPLAAQGSVAALEVAW